MKKIAIFVIVWIFAMVVGTAYFMWTHFVNEAASNNPEEIIFEVVPGQSFRTVAHGLEKQGLIKNANLFTVLGKITGRGSKMKVGEYSLARNLTPNQVLAVIVSGKSIERKLTLSEGLSIFEVAEIFEQAGLAKTDEFLKTVNDKEYIKSLLGEEKSSLEGYLFPETYSFTKYTNFRDVIAEMVHKFQNVYKDVESASQIRGLSRHQIVTLASIIEKETGAPEERPLISSVFHNRLTKGMLLQTDPTIIYGKAMKTGKIEINITRADLSAYTPYNTYVIKGLPPGPIANPGKEALMAAVRPAQSSYLYFVSHNDGTHQFSEDYKSHLKAVEKFQLDPKARAGKSWRDLNKRTAKAPVVPKISTPNSPADPN